MNQKNWDYICSRGPGSGVRTDNYVSLHWKYDLIGKRSPKKFVQRLRLGIFFVASLSSLFRSNAMTRFSTKNNVMNLRFKTMYGMTSPYMPWWLGKGSSNTWRLAFFQLRHCSKASTKQVALTLEVSLVGEMTIKHLEMETSMQIGRVTLNIVFGVIWYSLLVW